MRPLACATLFLFLVIPIVGASGGPVPPQLRPPRPTNDGVLFDWYAYPRATDAWTLYASPHPVDATGAGADVAWSDAAPARPGVLVPYDGLPDGPFHVRLVAAVDGATAASRDYLVDPRPLRSGAFLLNEASASGADVTLSWDRYEGTGFAAYEVYRGDDQGFPLDAAHRVARVTDRDATEKDVPFDASMDHYYAVGVVRGGAPFTSNRAWVPGDDAENSTGRPRPIPGSFVAPDDAGRFHLTCDGTAPPFLVRANWNQGALLVQWRAPSAPAEVWAALGRSADADDATAAVNGSGEARIDDPTTGLVSIPAAVVHDAVPGTGRGHVRVAAVARDPFACSYSNDRAFRLDGRNDPARLSAPGPFPAAMALAAALSATRRARSYAPNGRPPKRGPRRTRRGP